MISNVAIPNIQENMFQKEGPNGFAIVHYELSSGLCLLTQGRWMLVMCRTWYLQDNGGYSLMIIASNGSNGQWRLYQIDNSRKVETSSSEYLQMPVKYSSYQTTGWSKRLERMESTRLLLDFGSLNIEENIFDTVCIHDVMCIIYLTATCQFECRLNQYIEMRE